jgi:hypothetical protein
MTMATPTTSKIAANPATTRPAAHAPNLMAHERAPPALVGAEALCFSGVALLLADIGGLLGQPTGRRLLEHYKNIDLVLR